jgi:hypothetical protein
LELCNQAPTADTAEATGQKRHTQGATESRGSDFLQDAYLQAAWKIVPYFAGWKQHYSLYPVGASLLAAFKDELAAYEVDRGTIRFPLNAPVPVKLIEGIARFRAKNDPSR